MIYIRIKLYLILRKIICRNINKKGKHKEKILIFFALPTTSNFLFYSFICLPVAQTFVLFCAFISTLFAESNFLSLVSVTFIFRILSITGLICPLAFLFFLRITQIALILLLDLTSFIFLMILSPVWARNWLVWSLLWVLWLWFS